MFLQIIYGYPKISNFGYPVPEITEHAQYNYHLVSLCVCFVLVSVETMTVYFDHRVQPPSSGANVDIAWHPTHPYLAVATRPDVGGGFVQVYNEEVRPLLWYCL